MRFSLITTSVCLAVACAGTASAAPTGLFIAGEQQGGSGVTVRVEDNFFSVQRFAFSEHCTGPSGSFDEPVAFVEGSQASLDGRIKRSGRFKGRFEQDRTAFKVSGKIKGRHGRIKGSVDGSYEKDGETVDCHGTKTFKLRFVDLTGGAG
jgi:hypothetical protein